MAMAPSFIFNANQPGSYEEMQRRRAIADALSRGVKSYQPRNTVEGAGAVAEALMAKWNDKKATDMEQQGRKQASEQFNSMIAANGMSPEQFQGVDNPFMTDAQKSIVGALVEQNFAAPKPPTVTSIYDDNGMERKMQWDEKAGDWKPLGGSKAPSKGMTVYDRDGNPIMTTGNAKAWNEGERKDIFWAKRLRGSAPMIDQHEKALTDFASATGGKIPLVGPYFESQKYKLGIQASKEWIAPILRKETGAAVTDTEFDFYGDIFIPQPGDGPEVIAAKRNARVRAMEALEAGMSPAQIAAAGLEALGGAAPTPAPEAEGDEEIIDLGEF